MRAAVVQDRQSRVARAHGPISLGDLAQALEHSDEGFALTDPDGNYVYINEAHLRMYGYGKSQDLLGHSWRMLYTPEWVRHFEQDVLPILPRDLVWRGQVLGKKRDGTTFPAAVTLTLLPDGKITCNCRDESAKRKTTDAPREAFREIGERMLAGLPAKFRRPLDMLAGYTSFFLGELEAGRELEVSALRAGLTEIEATGQRLAEQLRRLELVARLTAGRRASDGGQDFCRTPGRWPRQLAAACRRKAESAGRLADLCVMLDGAALTLGYEELEFVVLELLTNAMQSSRAGDAVEICGRAATDSYELRVCDEGVGLPGGESSSCDTRPFGQSSPCGFGLDVVRFLLQRNSGRLEVESTCTAATCLKVILPLRR